MDNKIGFVVWGIRNGFKNNWLVANVDASVYQLLTDDMRQICNSTVDKFYSIEKIENNTVLSIFNPNTKDHVQRKAYIALSIVIPNGYEILGDAIGCLNSMLQTYEVKQGNAMVNMVNAEDIKAHLAQLQLKPESNFAAYTGNGIGVFHYTGFDQIQLHFNSPTIFGFKKVFFISGQNVALERIPGIQNVQSFAKPLFLTVSEFDPNKHTATINNQAITMSKTQVKQDDLIRVADFKTKQSKEFQIANNDLHISFRDLFPPIVNYQKPPSNNGNKNKIIALFSMAVLIIGGIIYSLLPSDAKVGGGSGTGPEVEDTNEKEFSAVYDFEKLELFNYPEGTSESTMFFIYKLNNDDSILIDSVLQVSSKSSKVRLNRSSDTLLLIRFKLDGKIQTKKIVVEFRLPNEHKILSGEALSKIADRYGIKKDSLMKWNKIANENSIRKGQVILLKPKVLNTRETEETEEEDGPSRNSNTTSNGSSNSSNSSNSGNGARTSNGGNSSGEAKSTPKASSNQNELEKLKTEIRAQINKNTDQKVRNDLNKRFNGCKDDLAKLKELKNDL